MASWQETPETGKTVWHPVHKNGIITEVDWQLQIVYCNFYDNGHQTVDYEDFIGAFDERLNQFVLAEI